MNNWVPVLYFQFKIMFDIAHINSEVIYFVIAEELRGRITTRRIRQRPQRQPRLQPLGRWRWRRRRSRRFPWSQQSSSEGWRQQHGTAAVDEHHATCEHGFSQRTTGDAFINILRAAFKRADPKSRALCYKLFFVKALTKRLRKLTIITKRL